MNTNNTNLFAIESSGFKMFGIKLDETKIRKIYDGFGDDFINFSNAPLEFEKFEKLTLLVNNNAEAYCASMNIIKAYDILVKQISLLNESCFTWKNYFDWNWSYKSELFDINDLYLSVLIEFLKHLLRTSRTSTTITGKKLFAIKYSIKRLSNVYVPVEMYSSLTAIIENILILQEEYEKFKEK